ncbi:hypothetical protein [Frondihabitans cladoniiphilus]|uniref:Excreted virulence factor EspC (Type VII ESX diderm) n=1 Tax=Frondihabitans cladoniiphilus TaxID=715785 RepID=A0ABP8WAW4_9MICO
MTTYRVDADLVLAAAHSLSAGADTGPSGDLPQAWGCGSPRVESLLGEDGTDFDTAWKQATDLTMSLSTGAVKAVDAYRNAEAEVAKASKGASAGTGHGRG